jgi:capsular polysaccharide transport system ATP-binding protein
MIHLLSVAKIFGGKGQPARLVFRPTSVTLPTDRCVGILGRRRQGKTVLLRLLAGLEAPDEGSVVAPLRLSPIVNSEALLDSRLTGMENIRVVARLYGIDADRFALAVGAFCGAAALGIPLKHLDAKLRKTMEMALTAVLPFDCYLLDHIADFGPDWIEQYFEAAARRQAGVIFATSNARHVREYADFVAVIDDYTVHIFDRVNEAIGFYER